MNASLPLARPDLLRTLARIGDRWLAADTERRFAHLAHLHDLPLFRNAREADPVFRLDRLIERTDRRVNIASMRPSAL